MVRILLVEDSPRDAELVLRELRREGMKVDSRRVQDEAALRSALLEFRPQLVISDFSMPGFNGMAALAICRHQAPDLPFVFMSGTIGEEVAVEAMRAGASDYVMKSQLARLGPAVARELRESEERERRRVADMALRRARDLAQLGHVVSAPDGRFESWSENLAQLLALRETQLPRDSREWLRLIHEDERENYRLIALESAERRTRARVEYRLLRGDGQWRHMLQVFEPMEGTDDARGRLRWFHTLQDVTAQRVAEAEKSASEALYRATFEQAPVGVVHTSLEGALVLANATFCEMIGCTAAQALEHSIQTVAHPEDLPRCLDGRASLLAGGKESYFSELRLLRPDGTQLWVGVTVSLVKGPDGAPSHFITVVHDISERKRAERDSERFRLAMDVSVDSIYLTDPASMRFVYVNQTACKRLGYTREELLTKGPHDVLGADEERTRRAYQEVIAAGEEGVRLEQLFIRSDGSEGWTELHRRALHTESGPVIVSIGRDITERREHVRRIERLTRMHAVLSGINAAIVRTRDRDALFREACRIAVQDGGFRTAWLGLVDRQENEVKIAASHGGDEAFVASLKGRTSMRAVAGEKAGMVPKAVASGLAMVSNDVTTDTRVALKKELRSLGVRSFAVLPIVHEDTTVAVFVLHHTEPGYFDAQEMKLLLELAGDIAFAMAAIERQQKLDYVAYYDPLTGMANRTLFIERLGQFLHTTGQAGEKMALVVGDVERLRFVNESLGRQAGDTLLKLLAQRLHQRGDRTELAHLGAGLFAVILPSVKGRSEALRRFEALWEECFGTAFTLQGTEVHVGGRAGIALFPSDGGDPEALVQRAEAALHRAKRTGERHLFHAAEMSERVAEKLTLESRLRQALERDEFVLYYQPKVDREADRICGVEALIRWNSPELGLVPPGRFIPLMEETGLILEAGQWAMTQAVRDHAYWTSLGIAAPRIAVNVSAVQLRKKNFVDTVARALKEGAPVPGIDLEITESLVMQDIQGNIARLKEVRALGVGLAIDDFGTGYSSLGYLARLPVQTLKIDRSFVITMLEDRDAMTLVQTIISLAHSLRLSVVAEGVDSEEQAKMLRLLRCDEMQGYLFSKPVPLAEITARLKKA
jgi:PAS domain S-box-containing protein/diguanylate cyclase (GGDEF)-like protein